MPVDPSFNTLVITANNHLHIYEGDNRALGQVLRTHRRSDPKIAFAKYPGQVGDRLPLVDPPTRTEELRASLLMCPQLPHREGGWVVLSQTRHYGDAFHLWRVSGVNLHHPAGSPMRIFHWDVPNLDDAAFDLTHA